ncbi:hypothetical protein FSP39_019519, partial [Pinctada imbricata]
GLAGCAAKTTVAPLDRIKILLQGHNHHYSHLGVLSTLNHVQQKEGVYGWYKGNGVHMIRVFPYAAIQFTSYEIYGRVLKVYMERHPRIASLLSGSLAGLTAVIFTYPLDVVRSRIAFQVAGEHIYSGFVHAVQSIYKDGGVYSLYKGIVPTLLGMVPYAGLSFYTFHLLKTKVLENFPEFCGKPCPRNTGGLVLILPAKLVCGGLAGAVAQTFSYPLDVVRRKMQLSGMYSKKVEGNWLRVLVHVYRDHGVQGGLYRGLSINYIRALPMQAVSFTVYELCKQWLGLDTGVER